MMDLISLTAVLPPQAAEALRMIAMRCGLSPVDTVARALVTFDRVTAEDNLIVVDVAGRHVEYAKVRIG